MPAPSNPLKKISQKNKTANISKRLKDLEDNFDQLVNNINNSLRIADNRLREHREVLDAVVSQYGEEEIAQLIIQRRQDKAMQEAQAAKESLEEALKEGRIVEVEEIGDDTIIAGHQEDENGEVVPPGYAQFTMAQVNPDFQDTIRSKTVGEVVDADGGQKFVITGLYEAAPEPPPAEETSVSASDEEEIAEEAQGTEDVVDAE